jgi:single-stranded-DNA-specific exonuclease
MMQNGELQTMHERILDKLFNNRGVLPQDRSVFLNPDYTKGLHDPFLMKDMQRAVDRIVTAIKGGEKILIYSDYDADGIPGAVILHDFFKEIGYSNFINYIPHRYNEGYGVHLEAIETFAKEGVHLIITVDCGISDHLSVKRAASHDIDVIITDHHLPDRKLPEAHAILNSKRLDDPYPFKHLSGSGVVFKLVQALAMSGSFNLKNGREKWLLDMVGIATVSDMVPLVGENRVLTHYGLKVLRKSPRPGLLKLLKKIRVDQKNITEDDIGFMISPRINAASRMGEPLDAFRMLASRDEVEGGMLATKLDKMNDERKGMVAAMVKDIKKRTDKMERKEVIVMGNPNWKPGLLGLAANTLVEKYNRSVFLWGREDSSDIRGSCRSDGSVNVLELMQNVQPGVFLACGGHEFAGGFSVSHDKIHFLEKELLDAYSVTRKIESKEKVDLVDEVLSLEDLTWEFFNLIDKLAPFGMGNPKPVFCFNQIEISEVKLFGKSNDHLELSFTDRKGKKIKAIGFFVNASSFNVSLNKGDKVNLIATLERSMFRGFAELRLRIVDVQK